MDVLSTYSKYKHITIWTHFTCFDLGRFISVWIRQFFHMLKIYYFNNHVHSVLYVNLNLVSFVAERTRIASQLTSDLNIQSRFVSNFLTISRLLDTPLNAMHGYAVDISCANSSAIFDQAKFYHFLTHGRFSLMYFSFHLRKIMQFFSRITISGLCSTTNQITIQRSFR